MWGKQVSRGKANFEVVINDSKVLLSKQGGESFCTWVKCWTSEYISKLVLPFTAKWIIGFVMCSAF